MNILTDAPPPRMKILLLHFCLSIAMVSMVKDYIKFHLKISMLCHPLKSFKLLSFIMQKCQCMYHLHEWFKNSSLEHTSSLFTESLNEESLENSLCLCGF